MNIVISIGNSDDKLGQAEWAKYVADVHAAVALEAEVIHGVWFSSPESKYQNAGFSFESDGISVRLQERLGEALERYRQDSIAVLAGEIQFITRGKFGGQG